MHVYNAIIVLKEVLPVFPVAAASGTAGYSLVTVLDRLLEKEERGDLKILARAYHASLKKRESIWAMSTDHKSGHVPMKVDSPARTSTPSGPGQDSRPTGQSANPPSAPRSHISGVNNGIVAPVQPKANQPLNSTKTEGVPRPDFIKRVGRGDKMDTTPDHPSTPEVNKLATSQSTREPPTGPAKPTPPTQPRRASPVSTVDARKDLAHVKDQSRPPSPSSARDPPHSPRGYRGPDEWRDSPLSTMPPPTTPSQKPSAQELRETAKMTMGSRPPDKPDADKSSSQYDQNGHPPHQRSNSPSRPGTRNPSADSRGSGGRSRSAGEDERRDSRPGPSRREGLRSERGSRDRGPGRDGRESDREDRERDRHGERERKERDRTERDKDRERERERERDRERERERERDRDRNGGRDSRDRHRRDERDRKERPATRESAREQRESARESATVATTATPVETPTRPSDTPSRHRSVIKGEDGLGKRRRPADDDVSANWFYFASLS